jgi:hypothetical protein
MRQDGARSVTILLLALACVSACDAEERSFASVCDTAIVCDDFEAFEAGVIPSGKWRVIQEGGSLVVDSSKARSGSRSVKISVDAGDTFRTVMLAFDDTSKLPVSGNTLYGRAMVFFEKLPTSDLEWRWLIGKGEIPEKGYSAIYGYGGQLPVTGPDGSFQGSEFMAIYDTPDYYDDPMSSPNTSCWKHANGTAAPQGRWACLEWKFDGPNDAMQLWLDGYGVAGLAIDGIGEGCTGQDASYRWTAPTFREIYLGWETYLLDEARTLWIDDVALGTERIGCPE